MYKKEATKILGHILAYLTHQNIKLSIPAVNSWPVSSQSDTTGFWLSSSSESSISPKSWDISTPQPGIAKFPSKECKIS